MRDLIGKHFSYWEVLYEADRGISKGRRWICKCQCGFIGEVLQGNLLSGKSTKCRRCSSKRLGVEKRTEHRLYLTWKSMKNRCNNPNNSSYHSYGGRGIKVCDRWNSNFLLFVEDMYPSFIEGLTLDRLDNDEDYCPENCRWATSEEQSTNKRSNLTLCFEGSYYTESELVKIANISRSTFQSRRNMGWTISESVYGKISSIAPKIIEYDGKIFNNMKDLSEFYNINPATFRWRIRVGWSIEEAINGKSINNDNK